MEHRVIKISSQPKNIKHRGMMAATTGASNGGAAEPASNNAKSITRLLQHSILQLCNEHVGYSHKLQILGVLCMTIDDEQQELVVKVNNTLKRVAPNAKDPVPQTGTHITTSTPAKETQSPHFAHNNAMQLNGGSSGPMLNGMVNGHSNGNGNGAERKSHGRKRANPVKVHQVYDEAEPVGSDDEEPVTVIPEAPEVTEANEAEASESTTMSMTSMSASPSGGLSTVSSKSRLLSTPTGDSKASGSAKRKPSQQFRVPQLTSTPTSSSGIANSFIRQALSESAVSPASSDVSEAGVQNLSSSASSSHANNSGLSLPIYVAANSTPQENGVNPIEITPDNCSDSEQEFRSRSPSKSPGDLYIDEGNTSIKVKQEPSLNTSFASSVAAAEGGSEGALDFSRSGLQTMASLYGLTPASLLDASSMAAQMPFTALNLMTSIRPNDFSMGSSVPDSDGLTIKYTSTGPYTVGANGKDVSNSSRIKDIIMYDEQSVLHDTQKAGRMESDFIVDKLGMDGRKRRRRAPEDQLTPEEIAEYLGQPEKAEFSFKCKYCTEVFDSVTRYIHHTLASHQAYICHQCGKSFTTKSSLLRHRPIHTGMRRVACSICKKTFYRKDKCKAHIKRHLGLEPGQPTPAQTPNPVTAAFQIMETSAIELVE